MKIKQARRVVVGLDFSDASDAALLHAFETSGGERGDELHVVHVTGGPVPANQVDFMWEEERASLAETSESLRRHVEHELDGVSGQTSFERVTLHVRVGPAAEGIARLAAEVDADMIVIGTHGRRGAQSFLIGSVAERTVQIAGCPVLVVRRKDHSRQAQAVAVWDQNAFAMSGS